MLNPDDKLPRLRFRLLPTTEYTHVGAYQHELENNNDTFEAIVAHPSSTPNKEEALYKVGMVQCMWHSANEHCMTCFWFATSSFLRLHAAASTALSKL